MTSVKLKWLVSSANAGEVIDKSNWGDGEELLYTCAREILRSDFQGFPRWKRATADDLLLTRNGTPYIHIPAEGAIYSNVVQRISVPKVDKFFLRYALEDRVRSFRGYGVSIESLNYEMWSNLEVPLPDLPTQRRIAGFLDRETARIDRLIEKKQRLVDMVAPRFEALVHEAREIGDWRRFGFCAQTTPRPIRKSSDATYIPLGLFNRGRGFFRKPETAYDDLGDSSFFFVNCPIPDDHIAPSRSSLFLARSVLRGIRNGGYDANQAA